MIPADSWPLASPELILALGPWQLAELMIGRDPYDIEGAEFACLDPGRETISARALLLAEAWHSTIAFLGPGGPVVRDLETRRGSSGTASSLIHSRAVSIQPTESELATQREPE